MITLARLVLLGLVIALPFSAAGLAADALALALLVVVFALDGVDGWVARRRGECSLFGSVFDIAADRVVENALWVVLACLGRVPVWVPIVVIARGVFVDAIRSVGASRGEAPFDAMKTPLGQFLVASRFMRALYGVAKTVAFAWLFMLPIVETAWPELWHAWHLLLVEIGDSLVLVAVTLCIVRGLPVVLEFIEREEVLRRA